MDTLRDLARDGGMSVLLVERYVAPALHSADREFLVETTGNGPPVRVIAEMPAG